MLAVLHRMHDGQIPYRDFEFLYGPLLIYPAHWWMQATGFSLTSYYAFYSITQAFGMAALMMLVIRATGRERGAHWLAFLLLFPFFFDTLLGVNWYGLRRLLPLMLLVFVATNVSTWRRVGVAGVGAGLLLAYSHDYGVAALLSMAALFLVLAVVRSAMMDLVRGAAVGAIAVVTWYGATVTVLGLGGFNAYIASTRELVARFAAGEAGFTFYWTASALALFAILTLGIVRVAVALPRVRSWTLDVGDCLLIMSLVYALVLLKAGLNRADIYHLTPPFLALVFVVVLGLPAATLRLTARERRVGLVLTAIASAATALAHLPTGSALARGGVTGMTAWMTGAPRGLKHELDTRTVALVKDQVDPDSNLVALAHYLADPERAARPVYFYGSTYSMPPMIGVQKRHYINDDFMYSVARGLGERAYLEAHPNAVVVISQGQWSRLVNPLSGTPASEYAAYLRPTFTKRLIDIASSVHFRGVPDELVAREQRWRETVGEYLLLHHQPTIRIGDVVVLDRVR